MNGIDLAEDMRRKPANAAQIYKISSGELPICCPRPGTARWNSHPVVYLPVAECGGRVRCPYCSAEFVLED